MAALACIVADVPLGVRRYNGTVQRCIRRMTGRQRDHLFYPGIWTGRANDRPTSATTGSIGHERSCESAPDRARRWSSCVRSATDRAPTVSRRSRHTRWTSTIEREPPRSSVSPRAGRCSGRDRHSSRRSPSAMSSAPTAIASEPNVDTQLDRGGITEPLATWCGSARPGAHRLGFWTSSATDHAPIADNDSPVRDGLRSPRARVKAVGGDPHDRPNGYRPDIGRGREVRYRLCELSSAPDLPPKDGRIGAGVAQLVERQPSKLDVAGSNPVSRSTFL